MQKRNIYLKAVSFFVLSTFLATNTCYGQTRQTLRPISTAGVISLPTDEKVKDVARGIGELAIQNQQQLKERLKLSNILMKMAMKNEETKVNLLHFIDVLPKLSNKGIVKHLGEYIPFSNRELPLKLRLLAGAGRLFGRLPYIGPWVVGTITKLVVEKVARSFVAGLTPEEVLGVVEVFTREGKASVINNLGEKVLSKEEAEAYLKTYLKLLKVLGEGDSISIKPSALYSEASEVDPEGTKKEIKRQLYKAMRQARRKRVVVNTDMEHHNFKKITLDIFEDLIKGEGKERQFKNFDGFGTVLQAYLKDSEEDLDRIIELAEEKNREPWLRLVKGCLWEYEKSMAEHKGWEAPVFERKSETDRNFNRMALKLLAHRKRRLDQGLKGIRPAFGTHNLMSIAYIISYAQHLGLDKSEYEFQFLYGMGDSIALALLNAGYTVRIYTPEGKLISGMAYLVRRILENTSADSFLRQLFLEASELEELLITPDEMEEKEKQQERLQQQHIRQLARHKATALDTDIANLLYITDEETNAKGEDADVASLLSYYGRNFLHLQDEAAGSVISTPVEENRYFYTSRGDGLVIIDEDIDEDRLRQILSAPLATGNKITVYADSKYKPVIDSFNRLFKKAGRKDIIEFHDNVNIYAAVSPRYDWVFYTGPKDREWKVRRMAGETPRHQKSVKRVITQADINPSFLRNFILPKSVCINLMRRGFAPDAEKTEIDTGFRNFPADDFSLQETHDKMDAALKQVEAEIENRKRYYRPIIAGKEVVPKDRSNPLVSVNPADPDQFIGIVYRAGIREAEMAIKANKEASEEWRNTPVKERVDCLRRAAKFFIERRFYLAAWVILEAGKTRLEALGDVYEAIDMLNSYAKDMEWQEKMDAPWLLAGWKRIPLGLGAVITPWNFPVAILTGPNVASVVAGNTGQMKPAEQSPVVAAKVMGILQEAGFPPGVINFLPGVGEEVGKYLVEHPDTDLIAFTGSEEVGLGIVESASQAERPYPKQVIMETGGKNAIIVTESADLDNAVSGGTAAFVGYSGQKCSAHSRSIVHEAVYDEYCSRLKKRVESIKIGDPRDKSTTIGPLIDQEAKDKVLRFIKSAKDYIKSEENQRLPEKDRMRILIDRSKDVPNKGYYVGPVVFINVPPDIEIAQEEIFGPVLCVMKAKNFQHAIDIANSTRFGLTASVYTRTPSHIEQAIEKIEVGNLYINRTPTGAVIRRQPFGGFKHSGIGSKAGGPDYLQQFMRWEWNPPEQPAAELATGRTGFIPVTVVDRLADMSSRWSFQWPGEPAVVSSPAAETLAQDLKGKASSAGDSDTPLEHTMLTDWHMQHGGKMYAYAGFLMPQFYYDPTKVDYKPEQLARAEAVHTRRGASAFDVSHMTLIDIKGAKAAEFIDTIACPNIDKDDNVRPFNDKDIQYRHILNIEALNIDDIQVIRITEDHFRLVVNAGNAKRAAEWLHNEAPVGNLREGCKITDLRDAKTKKERRIILAVQGTNGSQEIMQKLVKDKDFDLKELDYFKSDFVTMDIDGEETKVLIQRTGYTGEDGFEVHLHPDHAVAFWEKVIELGAKPAGLMSRNILRTEAGFPLHSNELAGDEGAMAFEYKYGFVLSLKDSGPDYIGKAAAIEKSKSSTKRLAGIRVLGREIDSDDNAARRPKDKDKIFDPDGKEIGHITSVVFSPNLNSYIGLAYIDKENAKIGTKLASYKYRVKVVKAPFINHVISDRGMDRKETSEFFLPTDDADRRKKLEFVNKQFNLGLDLENMSTDDAIDVLFGPLQEHFFEKGSLGLDKPITSRRELFRSLYKISLKNKQGMTSFKGGGYYDEPGSDLSAHLVTLLGFLMSYTPYIAESSQGNTTLMFLYQSLMAMFLDMDVVNASLYEGSSSLSEGVRMAIRATGRKKVIVAGDINPRHKKVLGTQMKNLGIEPVFIFQDKPRSLDLDRLEKEIDEETAAVIVQQPNFLGEIASYFSLDEIRDMAAKNGAKFHIHSNDPMVFAMIKPPGRYGADIVTAEGQAFVGAPYSGGTNLGIIACKRELINYMPGRMVVQTKDADGQTAFALGLGKGEQNYAREKANCNICTNAALNALCCALFFLEQGKDGLKNIAEDSHATAVFFAHGMSGQLKIPGFKVFNKSAFFREVIIESPIPADELQKRLAEEFNIDAAIDISKDFLHLGKNLIQFSFTAKHTIDDANRLIDALKKISEDLGREDEKKEISHAAIGIYGLMQRGKSANFSGPDQEKYDLQIPFVLEEVLREIISDLNKLNYNPRQQKIVLGSCTMMTNPLINEIIAMLPGFAQASPYRRPEDMQGTLQIIYELCEYIRKLTGMDFASVNPAAGAHGEYAGLTAIHRYQVSEGQGHRNIVLVTDSSHGTNAASSAMANAIVIEIKTDPKTGRLDLEDLNRVVSENKGNISAIMLTEPNTIGLFEDLKGAADLVLADGGEVYWDGANFNSVIGRVLIAELGVTMGQGNSHKSLAGVHGGGGPGAGFVFCKSYLAPFMPNPRVVQNADLSYDIKNAEDGIDIGSFFGNTPNHVKAYAYIIALGEKGLRAASGDAVLNANYLLGKLIDHKEFIIPCDLDDSGRPRLRMHEFVVLLSKIKKDTGVGPMDFAMRLQDFGIQPTVLFPRIKGVVDDPLMFEPTQSLTTEELDFIAKTMIAVMRECYDRPEFVMKSPHDTPIGSERKFSRIDTHSEPTTAIVKAKPEQIGAVLGLGELSFEPSQEKSTTLEYEEPAGEWGVDKGENTVKGVMWHRIVTVGGKRLVVVGLTEKEAGVGGTFKEIEAVNQFPEVGSELDAGDELVDLEIEKASVSVESNIKGKVIKVNNYLFQDPATINQDPLNRGWLVVLELPDDPSAEPLAPPTANILAAIKAAA